MSNLKLDKKVKFITLGCKVNQYETQGIREQFLRSGFRENNGKVADVYVINTCTVTARTDSESRRLIRKAIQSNPRAKVIVTGCYVEKDARQIRDISDRVQIIPNQQKHRIFDFLDFTNHERRTTNDESFIPLNISTFAAHERAFVKIQDGCNNFCAYCIVPYVRGSSRSRNLQEILAEAERLVGNGYKEIVLTGICLGDYRDRNFSLVDVLIALEKIKGEFRIRLSSIEPQLISSKLIEKIADSVQICPHLHIPLQSGDNQILKRMNRQYTIKAYLSLIAKVKKKIKDAAITTDILVGFPGEKEKNFRNTVRYLKEIVPLRTHIFSFSPRQGTAASKLQGRLEPQIVRQRVNLLKKVAEQCSYKYRRRFLGKKLTVLIESQENSATDSFCGYSENYIRVIVNNATQENVNHLIDAEVEIIDSHFTKARFLGDK